MNWLFGSRPGHTRRTYDRGIPPRIAAGIVFRGIPVNYGTFLWHGQRRMSAIFKREYENLSKVETKCEQKVRKDTKEQIVQKEEKEYRTFRGVRHPASEIHRRKKIFGNVEKGADGVLETSGVYKAMAEPLAQLAVDGIAFLFR